MTPPVERPPVVWRLPPWQPAVLFLITAGLAAWAIYGGPNTTVRAIAALVGLAFLAGAIAAARMYLVADDEGIGFRRFTGETSVPWDDLAEITITRMRGGSMTLELMRHSAGAVHVPPSLVLPARPTSNDKTRTLLGAKAAQLRGRRPGGR